jgi:hypothetical protein
MLITAKFAGRCASCNEPFSIGDKIEWEPGLKPRHPDCYLRDERVGRPDPQIDDEPEDRLSDDDDLGEAFNAINITDDENEPPDADRFFDEDEDGF